MKLDNQHLPRQLEETIAGFITYYNKARYPEALNNVILGEMYHGRAVEFRARRAQIRADTMRERRRLRGTAHTLASAALRLFCTAGLKSLWSPRELASGGGSV